MSFSIWRVLGTPAVKRPFKNLIQYFPNLFEHGVDFSDNYLEQPVIYGQHILGNVAS